MCEPKPDEQSAIPAALDGEEQFSCFYTLPPIWAGTELKFGPEYPHQIDGATFYRTMSETIRSYEREPYSLRICRDGLFMLRVHALESEHKERNESRWLQRGAEHLRYLNCLNFLIDSVGHTVDTLEIRHLDAFRMRFKDGKMVGAGAFNPRSYAQGQLNARWLSEYIAQRPVSMDPRLGMREDVSVDQLDAVEQKFFEVTANPDLLDSIVNISKSLAEYRLGNFEVSVVLAWFEIESQLNALWSQYYLSKDVTIGDDEKRVNGKRKKILEGATFTASIVSNVLELADVLSYTDLKRMNLIRDYRNKIAHGLDGFECDETHCREAIVLATDLALRNKGFDVQANLGIGRNFLP